MKRLLILPLLLAFTVSALAQNQTSLQGDWNGHITIMGNPLPITTHFTADDSLRGTIDIQGATLPLQNIRTTETDSVYFQFTTNVNVAQFKGLFTNDSTIAGNYYQAGQQFSFELKRSKAKSKTGNAQTKTPLPYNHKKLVIKNDSIKIGGTLTWPKNTPADQLVIIISGSGAQDRDGTAKPITDFQPYAVLADSLTTAGIATFRYDDRGVGQSTGNFRNTTLDILASDVDAIISDLSNQSDHNFGEIILLGHSQGGVVAGKVAAENEAVDKLILMASTGVSLKKVLRFQVKQAFTSLNLEEALIEKEITARENLMQAIVDDKNVDQAKEKYRRQFKAVQLAAGADSAQAAAAAKKQATQLTTTFQAPQTQPLLFYDPTDDLKTLDIPVLVLFGGKDTQVTVKMNQDPIEKALNSGDAKHQTEIFTEANHLFQKANTGQVQEYGTLPSKFIDGFTTSVAEWMLK